MTTTMITVADDVELCVQTFGDPADPTVLLLSGVTAAMDWWDAELCQLLADAGRHVVRFDNRDTGASTTWPVGKPGYSGEDLTTDPLRILDHLGVDAAHLVGVSMGGGIAQSLALRAPARVLSLTLIATTCAYERESDAALPGMDPRVSETVDARADEVDWDDVDAVVAEFVRVQTVFAGGLGVDSERVESIARDVVRRSHDVRASVVNGWIAVGSGGDEESTPRHMADIEQPTLVVHGSDDPMFPLPHGQALAEEIAGAELLVVPGMGHEVPPRSTWQHVVPAIVDLTTGRRTGIPHSLG